MKSEFKYVQTEDGQIFRTLHPENWAEAKLLTQKEGERLYREEMKKSLLSMLNPSDTVYTCCRSVSRSGMQRKISLHIVVEGRLHNITGMASIVMGWPLSRNEFALKVNGGGMDMGFHCVYTLGKYLWPEGTEKPHGTRNGEPDRDGGYALNHEWL